MGNKLTMFLNSAIELTSHNCVKVVSDWIAEYFNGVRPTISKVLRNNKQEWEKYIAETFPDSLGRVEDYAENTRGTNNNETNEIDFGYNTDFSTAVHEMVHGVLSSKVNESQYVELEEALTEAVALEIIAQHGLKPDRPSEAYAEYVGLLNKILSAIKMTLKEFANQYLKSVNYDNQAAWVDNFIIERWKELGKPQDANWRFVFNLIPDLQDYV